MNMEQLRRVSVLLAETKTTIATPDTWTIEQFFEIRDGIECYCVMGALHREQCRTMWNMEINIDEASTQTDATLVETQNFATEMLSNDAKQLFRERIKHVAPYSFESCPVAAVNDHLGFEAVHQLLDYTIARVSSLINNYEHSADPY
jgi:hypothetical protein